MKYFSLIMSLFLLMGCSSLSPIGSIEGTVEDVKSNKVQVNCTSTVNRDKDGDIEDIGYTCDVNANEDTIITDLKGQQVSMDQLEKGQKVQVVLSEEKDVNENEYSRVVTAQEINILE